MSEKPYWEGKEYSFFSHKNCEYFPCHKTAETENFNCLFCYCPLYALGEHCGGNFRYNERGIKDCTNCLLPHKRENYGYITGKFQEIMELAARKEEK
jgi:Zn-finger protein